MNNDSTVVVSAEQYQNQIVKATAYDILQALVSENEKALFSIEEINKIIAEVIYA